MERKLRFSRHARNRMLEWRLDVGDVRAALQSGKIIEEYEDGTRLILGRSGIRPLHLVIKQEEAETTFLIMVYEPDPLRWDPSFRRRIEP